MTPAIKNEINNLIHTHKFIMLEFVDGKCYWLHKHYRYLDPEDAPKVLIGLCGMPSIAGLRNSNRNTKSKIVYLTHKL